MIDNREEKDRARIIGELYAPLPGQSVQDTSTNVGPWSDAEMAASFKATQSAFAGKRGVK